MSYRLVDEFIWLGLKDQFNDFRQNVIGLPPIGNWGAHVLNDKMVPFVKMWSPSLVPKVRSTRLACRSFIHSPIRL